MDNSNKRHMIFRTLKVRDHVSIASLSILAGGAFSFGSALAETGHLSQSIGVLVASFLLLTAVFAAVYLFAPTGLRKMRDAISITEPHVALPKLTFKSIAITALIILCAWLTIMVSMYPGSMNWDTYYQITQCYPGDYPVWVIPYAPTNSITTAWFSDHHPLFDTLIFGLFARASDAVTGSWNLGIFSFVTIQSYLTSMGMAASVAYLERIGTPRIIRLVCLVFCCCFPVFPLFAATMLKDSFFSMFFIPYILIVCEFVRTKGRSFEGNRKMLIAFFALSILLCLTKKPGMYVVILTSLIYLILFKRFRLLYISQLAASVIIMNIILPLAVFPALNVIPGGKQEALGPLFQQTARYVTEHPDEVTDVERSVINSVLRYDDLAVQYDPFSSDYVKNWFKYNSATSEDISNYIRVWIAQGLKHPETYFIATWCTAAQYINLDATISAYTYTGDVAHAGSDKLAQPEWVKPLHNGVTTAFNWIRNAPAVSIFFKIGLYSFVLPSLAYIYLLRQRSNLILAFAPIALSLLVCIVTPVVNARYALPLIYLAPLFIGMIFLKGDTPNRHEAQHFQAATSDE